MNDSHDPLSRPGALAYPASRCEADETVTLSKPEARDTILTDPEHRTLRKSARILAIESHRSFVVATEQGVVAGSPGDWLVMNHPDDDPGGDAWPVSAERFEATYVDEEDIKTDTPGIRAWLMEDDRLYTACLAVSPADGLTHVSFANRLLDELDPPVPPPEDVSYLTIERAVDAGFEVRILARLPYGSNKVVEISRDSITVIGQGATISEAVARARTKFELDYPHLERARGR